MRSEVRQTLLVVSLVGMAALSLWVATQPDQWQLWLVYFYAIPTNSFIPIPHEPGILYFSRSLPPLPVSLVAVAATCVAGCLDYFVLSRVLFHRILEPITHHESYRLAIDLFQKYPFLAIFSFALIPLPYYPIRLLSIGSRYPLARYLLALSLGRWPRYYLLAVTGAYLQIPPLWLLVFGSVMTGGFLFALRRRHQH